MVQGIYGNREHGRRLKSTLIDFAVNAFPEKILTLQNRFSCGASAASITSCIDEIFCLISDSDKLENGPSDDFIDSYISLKMEEVIRFEHTPHPVEFEMYYSA